MTFVKKLGKIVGALLLTAIGLLVVYLALAAVAFYRPRPADLPCRGCSGGASAVLVNGFELYYWQVGNGIGKPPIVILHGGPGHSTDSLRGSLDFLADEYRVVYYDQRGSGHSQIKPDSSLYTVEQLVGELEVLRRDVIGADHIILIAHSAGGALAQRYALSYGQHLEKMILISSIPVNNGVAVPLLWDAFGPGLFVLGVGVPPADPLAANERFAATMVETSVGRLYNPADRALLEDSGLISFATWREVSRSLEGSDYHESLGQVDVSTLVLYGEADGPSTGQAVASRICGQLPNCRLVGFQRSGHWPFLEEPDRFAEVVRTFLSEP